MKQYTIEGMGCERCRNAVTKAISGIEGVTSVNVSLEEKRADVCGDHSEQELIKAVEAAGFSASPVNKE